LHVHGVAANRIGGAYHAKLLAESLPPDLHWFGALPRDPALALPERHLGLVAAGELAGLDARLDALADALEAHADLALPPPVAFAEAATPAVPRLLEGRRVAIARDDAFCFLYPANVDLLIQAGAELRWFSPLAGDALPECDAAWLPGGYPELHLARLSGRTDLHAALRAHVEAGRPLLAECGGMLSLLDALAASEGDAYAMAGLLPGWAVVRARLSGLGMQSVALPEGTLRGHTFHYAHADIAEAPLVHATNPDGGPASEAVYRRGRLTASFVHFYFPSAPEAALRLFLP
jgi:cobyrinic acid a,c-diamide synthase